MSPDEAFYYDFGSVRYILFLGDKLLDINVFKKVKLDGLEI